MTELRCYFCRAPVVPGEIHQIADCCSALKEQRDSLEEQLAELIAELSRLRLVDTVSTGG